MNTVAIIGSGLAYTARHMAGLGMVPVGARSVTPVPANLKALVPKPTGGNETIKSYGADPISDTVPLIKRLIKRQAWQGRALAQALEGDTLEQTLRNNWNFIFRHIQYVKDPEGEETVRSLRRLVHEGKGDCDCFVNALGNLLTNQKIKFSLRVARYNGATEWSHIYIIVPKSAGGYYTLDPVVHQFNYEVPPSATKDFSMKLVSMDGFGPGTGAFAGLGFFDSCSKPASAPTAPGSAQPAPDAKQQPVTFTTKSNLEAIDAKSTFEALDEANVPYTSFVNEQGEVVIEAQTPAGIAQLPAVLDYTSAQQLQQLNTVTPVAPKNNNAMGWVLGLSSLALLAWAFSGSSAKPALSGPPRKTVRKLEVGKL